MARPPKHAPAAPGLFDPPPDAADPEEDAPAEKEPPRPPHARVLAGLRKRGVPEAELAKMSQPQAWAILRRYEKKERDDAQALDVENRTWSAQRGEKAEAAKPVEDTRAKRDGKVIERPAWEVASNRDWLAYELGRDDLTTARLAWIVSFLAHGMDAAELRQIAGRVLAGWEADAAAVAAAVAAHAAAAAERRAAELEARQFKKGQTNYPDGPTAGEQPPPVSARREPAHGGPGDDYRESAREADARRANLYGDDAIPY